jgi:putative serine protease PepD
MDDYSTPDSEDQLVPPEGASRETRPANDPPQGGTEMSPAEDMHVPELSYQDAASDDQWDVSEDWKSSGYPSASKPAPPPPPPDPGNDTAQPPGGSLGEPAYEVVTGPLPVCEYTGEPGEEPCEEPATVKRWSSGAVVLAAALGALAGGVLVASAVLWITGVVPGLRPFVESPLGTPAEQIDINPESNLSFSEAVAAKVTPSVVNVSIQRAVTDPVSGVRQLREAGNGSGVIIDPEGYILTNEHVIAGADRIIIAVGLDDVEAEVVGRDVSTDLAVLKIPAGDYPGIEIGSSDDLRVGQFVVAVGSPFGLEKTVTAGIITALQRSSFAEGPTDLTAYTNLIQTDAAINPGNSGGALVDEQGRLIGVNTLIQSPSGSVGAPQSAGIGFAIPVDFAIDIADQLIEDGTVELPYMGVSTATIDENLAEQFDLEVSRGALVRFVEPGSPADEAGLERGDIVLVIAQREIEGVEDVFAAVRAAQVGDTVEVMVVRNGVERTFDVLLGSDAITQ